MVERIYLIVCPHCKHRQQTVVRGNNFELMGKSRKCVYCGKNISLSRKNRIRRLK